VKRLLTLTTIAALTFVPSSAQAFDVGDALSILGAVESLTRDRSPREFEAAPSIEDIDLECRLRGFDGWLDGKCRNLDNNYNLD
jgi:hypothetical protein